MQDELNTRILVIDDEIEVRDSITLILSPSSLRDNQIQHFASDLFDDAPPAYVTPYERVEFTVDQAANGAAGVELVRAAVAANRPYAVAFVDIRMPGWDGLETVQHIRRFDLSVEVIFLTAYCDHTIEEIIHQAGPQVGYHLKPFAPDEIKQIATRAVYNWGKLKRMERLIDAHRKARKEYISARA